MEKDRVWTTVYVDERRIEFYKVTMLEILRLGQAAVAELANSTCVQNYSIPQPRSLKLIFSDGLQE